MSEIDKELDRLLGIPSEQTPGESKDSICSLSIELDKKRKFKPLTSAQEYDLATEQGPAAEERQQKYRDDLFKASRSLEKQYQFSDAEKALEKLVRFDIDSDTRSGITANHIFQLGLAEEFQGDNLISLSKSHQGLAKENFREQGLAKLSEAELHYQQILDHFRNSNDDIAGDECMADSYVGLARMAKRRGQDDKHAELLREAFSRDTFHATQSLKDASMPEKFNDIYFDWMYK